MKINKLIIDSTYSETDLCRLGAAYGTDKSPYNKDDKLHKHSYTAIYDLMFAPFRDWDINIAEVGILDNKSMMCWRDYFPEANLTGFEYFPVLIDNAERHQLANTSYFFMDIKSEDSIQTAFEKADKQYDIVIEDSTHVFEDQIRFINYVHRWMHPNGILVIEDIFREADEDDYRKELQHLEDVYYSATFIEANHAKTYSPGWNNDKLLVLYKS